MPMKNQIEIDTLSLTSAPRGSTSLSYLENQAYQKMMFSTTKTTATTAAQKSGF